MIFGYISKRKYSSLENYLEESYPKGITFRYRFGGKRAYFLRGDSDFSLSPIYHDSNSLFLCEGIPIRGSPDNRYELVDIIDDEDLKKNFNIFVDEIVSNVSTILFKNGNDPKLYLSSDRAGPGRIYYRHIGRGIAFSSSFSVLLHFAPSKINHKAIYSVLRYGFSPPPSTLSKDVYVVPPSHYVTVDLSEMAILHYPYFRFCFSEEHGFDLERLDTILDATSETLGQMNACLLLSGGVDSTLLAHKMHAGSSRNIRSYFLAFGKNDPELVFAREASESSDSQLNVLYMDESRLLETIDEIALSYDHLFKDISTIPTYYLMKHTVNEGEKIIVDGTGADGCFGSKTVASDRLWILAYSLPNAVKTSISSIYSYSNIWKKESFLEAILRTIAKSRQVDVSFGPFVDSPSNDVFFSNPNYDETIGRRSMSLVTNLTKPCSNGHVFKQRATVAAILFLCASRSSVKTHLRWKFHRVYTLYPYLWKDMLKEQGKISWSAKINNGIVKWPIKKLLEPYMPYSFIYRKKSGFDPDLETYIKNEKVYSLLKQTLTNPKIANVLINKSRFIKLMKRLPFTKHYSYSLCSLLWGLLFIELWMSKHRELFTHN